MESPYAGALAGVPDAFLYSPAALHAIAPLAELPFPVFLGLWTLLEVLAMVYLAGPVTLLVVLLPPVWLELVVANVNLVIAAAVVLGFRLPGAWAVVLITKVTPGIGLLWFAFRREWRSLVVALGVTAVIAAVSIALAPWLWAEWLTVLAANATRGVPPGAWLPVPLVARLPVALLLLAWGARYDQRWTVPVAAFLALPVIWESTLSMLVGVIPLVPWRRLATQARLRAARGPAVPERT